MRHRSYRTFVATLIVVALLTIPATMLAAGRPAWDAGTAEAREDAPREGDRYQRIQPARTQRPAGDGMDEERGTFDEDAARTNGRSAGDGAETTGRDPYRLIARQDAHDDCGARRDATTENPVALPVPVAACAAFLPLEDDADAFTLRVPRAGAVVTVHADAPLEPRACVRDARDAPSVRDPCAARDASGAWRLVVLPARVGEDALLTVERGAGSGTYALSVTSLASPALAAPTVRTTPTSPAPGDVVEFQVDAPEGAAAWWIDFGDGSSARCDAAGCTGDAVRTLASGSSRVSVLPGFPPAHAYARSGEYALRVSAVHADGQVATTSLTLAVRSLPPVAAFSWAPATPAPGEPVTFTDASTARGDAITTRAWTFAGDEDAACTTRTCAVTFPGAGVFEVTLTVTDSEGRDSTTTRRVNVGGLAGDCRGQVMVAISPDGHAVCEPDDVGAGGDATSAPAFTLTGAGPVRVVDETVTLSDEGCPEGGVWTWTGSGWACEATASGGGAGLTRSSEVDVRSVSTERDVVVGADLYLGSSRSLSQGPTTRVCFEEGVANLQQAAASQGPVGAVLPNSNAPAESRCGASLVWDSGEDSFTMTHDLAAPTVHADDALVVGPHEFRAMRDAPGVELNAPLRVGELHAASLEVKSSLSVNYMSARSGTFDDLAVSDEARFSKDLYVAGEAYKATSGGWKQPSDARTKRNVQPFDDGLDVLRALRPVSFEYNGAAGTTPGAAGVGVIAQELRDVAPYMTDTRSVRLNVTDLAPTDLLVVDTDALKFVTVNAVLELDAEVQALREENMLLEARLTAIEAALAALAEERAESEGGT